MSEDEEIIQSGPDAGKTVAQLRAEVFDPAVSDYEYFEKRMLAHGLKPQVFGFDGVGHLVGNLPEKWNIPAAPDELIFDEKLEHDEAVGGMEEWQRQFQGMPCQHFAGYPTETGRPNKWEPQKWEGPEPTYARMVKEGLLAPIKPVLVNLDPAIDIAAELIADEQEHDRGIVVPMGLGKSGQMRIGGNMPAINKLARHGSQSANFAKHYGLDGDQLQAAIESDDPDNRVAREGARRFLLRYGHDDPAGVTEAQHREYLLGLKAGELVVETEASALHRCQGVVYFNPDHPGSPCVKWETSNGPMGTSVTGGARRIDDLPWWPATPTVERKPYMHPALGAPYGRGAKLGGSFHAMAMLMALGGGFYPPLEPFKPRFHDQPADPIGRLVIDEEAEQRKRAERRQRKAEKKQAKRDGPWRPWLAKPQEIKEFKNSQRKRKK